MISVIGNLAFHSGLFFLLTALLGVAYTYCLLRAHFLAVKVDRYAPVSRSKCGEISVKDLRRVKTSVQGWPYATVAQTAILYMRISNLIAVSYLVGLALFVLLELL